MDSYSLMFYVVRSFLVFSGLRLKSLQADSLPSEPPEKPTLYFMQTLSLK